MKILIVLGSSTASLIVSSFFVNVIRGLLQAITESLTVSQG